VRTWGQEEELSGLNDKAIKTGASKLYIEDLKEEFITEYIYPTLKAGAVYEGTYCWARVLRVRLLPSGQLKLRIKKAQPQSPTARPEKATTRYASN